MMLIYERCRLSLLLPLSVYINILSNFNTLKILTLFVHAGLFWCFHNPPNSDNSSTDMDYRILNVRDRRVKPRNRRQAGRPRPPHYATAVPATAMLYAATCSAIS